MHILKDNQGKSILNDVMFDVYTEQYIQVAVKLFVNDFNLWNSYKNGQNQFIKEFLEE